MKRLTLNKETKNFKKSIELIIIVTGINFEYEREKNIFDDLLRRVIVTVICF